jgi:raffinose/stachyose/melibiose transport system substrate-binding protein
MQKQIKAVVLLCLVFVFVVAGCSNGNSTSSNSTEGSTASGDNSKVTIRVATRYAGSDALAPFLRDAEKAYMAANPNVNIVDESISDEAAYNNKFKTDLATGNLPAIFIVYSKSRQIEYAKNGLLLDLTPYLQSDKAWNDSFIPFNLNEFKFDQYNVNGTYGIPLFNATEMMYYNTDLFKNAGIANTPTTYEELVADISKLKESGVVPWEVGSKDTWRSQHIQSILLYKNAGVQQAIDMGQRKTKWTDPAVVQSLQQLQDLNKLGAFEPNTVGVGYDTAKADFLTGKGAMIFDGSWLISEVMKSDLKDKVKAFMFPYMADKPQFKDTNMVYPNALNINSKLTDAQKNAAVDFVKFLTSKEYQDKMVYDYQNLPVTNLQLDQSKVSPLFQQANEFLKSIKDAGNDTFYYDPLASMQDRVRNSIIGVLMGNAPDAAAKEIQSEIDKNS